MKKIILLLSIASLFSCKKAEPTEPKETPNTGQNTNNPTPPPPPPKTNLTVVIKGFRTIEGQALIGIYNKEEHFLSADKTTYANVSPVASDSVVMLFENIVPGVYAASVFHDKNSNNNLDQNFIGIPVEDFGFSNNAMGSFGPPSFDDAKFEVKQGSNVTHTIELKNF